MAFLLMTFTKKLMFKNRVNRVILPKTKRLPVCGTLGICGMSTYMYDPLRVAPSDLFGQRREAVTGGKKSLHLFLRKESFHSFLFNQLGEVQNKHSIN